MGKSTSNFMSSLKKDKLLALFFVAVLLLNFPIMRIFGKDKFVFGFPALYVYVFFVWLVIILLTAKFLGKGKD